MTSAVKTSSLIQVTQPQIRSKQRTVAITLLVLGILLIASGIIFLAVAIPGLSSAVALGLGCGMTALGTVLLITGLVLLIRSEKLALEQVEIKQARTRVNNELDQLSQYVFYTENVLDNLKRWSYRDLGFVRQAQEEVTNLEQDIEEIFLTLRDIRNALDNEEFFMTHAKQCLAQVGESLFQDASIDEFINLAHLSEIRQHLDINDPRWSMITKKVKGTVVRFIYVSTMYKQIKSNFEKSDFGQLRKMLLNNYKTIEEVLYQSFQKGYNRAALLSEKTRIIHTSSLLHWEKDEDKHLNIKNECASRLENFKKFRTLFLGLSEEDVIDFTGASGWDCSKLPRKEVPLDGGKKKLRFKRTFADEQVGDWDRTTSLEHMTPQEEDPLDRLMDQVEQEATSVLKDQDRYWKEIETSEAKFRSLPQEDDFEKQSQIDSYIRDLDDHLSVWANQLSAAEDALIEVTDVQEHGNREMLKNIQQGLELIEDAVKATLPRVDFIQELLEKEELPLVAARMSLENSYLKISSCAEIMSEVKPLLLKNDSFDLATQRFQNLINMLQEQAEIYNEYEEKNARVQNEIKEQKDFVKRCIEDFEARGLGVLKEELASLTRDFHDKAKAETSMLIECPCIGFYYSIHQEEQRQRQERLQKMAERYRDCKQVLEAVQVEQKDMISPRVVVDDSYFEEEKEEQKVDNRKKEQD